MHCFKIWDNTREKKAIVVIQDGPDLYEQLIVKASAKLEINGSYLVLESDGTKIDENEALIELKSKEIFLLLQPEEKWHAPFNDKCPIPVNSDCGSTSALSTASTASISSISSPNTNCDTSLNLSDVDIDNLNVSLDQVDSQCDNHLQVFQVNFEYVWSNYMIPWDKIPNNLICACEAGSRKKQIVTDIVHIIINDMRGIKEQIPRSAIKLVARQLCKKYPKTFGDFHDDGDPVADGSCTIFSKLLERASYLNRPHKRESGHQSLKNVSPALKKRRLNSMAGCSNWQPPTTTDHQSSRTFAENTKIDDDTDDFYKILEESYPDQRAFLNNIEDPPSVPEIKKKWPLLFNKRAIKWHFQKLTNTDLTILEKQISDKAEKIIKFGVSKKIISTVNQENVNYQALQVLAKYFKEDFNLMHHRCEDHKCFELIEEIKINAPCIVESNKDGPNDCYIYVEKEKILANLDFMTAFSLCFALYFIMNLEYPKGLATFLEMIQRCFLKIHPESGSKSSQKKSKKRVIALMNQLQNYC